MTSAEQRAWERWRRQRLAYEAVMRLHRRGIPIKQISRTLGVARNTIRRWVGGGEPGLHRPRISSLAPYWSTLGRRWAEGCRNGAQLWHEFRCTGFTGSLRVVTEWATRQRLTSRPGRLASGASVSSCRRTARADSD